MAQSLEKAVNPRNVITLRKMTPVKCSIKFCMILFPYSSFHGQLTEICLVIVVVAYLTCNPSTSRTRIANSYVTDQFCQTIIQLPATLPGPCPRLSGRQIFLEGRMGKFNVRFPRSNANCLETGSTIFPQPRILRRVLTSQKKFPSVVTSV